MIKNFNPGINYKRLVGKYIFHNLKGTLPLYIGGKYAFNGIGTFLGKVTEIGGPNRIYYLDENGERLFVSDKGVGYFCNSMEEVELLLKLKDDATKSFEELKVNYFNVVRRVVTPHSVDKI